MAKKRMTAKERRRNILDAALKVIADSNYHEATTAKIAAEAGITEPIIYIHFKNKRELFLELLEDIRQTINGVFEAIVADGDDAITSLKNLVMAHYEFVIRHGERYKVVSLAVSVNDEKVRKKLINIYSDLREFFRDQFTKALSEGILVSDVDIDELSLIALSWINMVGVTRVLGAEETIPRGNMDKILDMMEKGLRKNNP